MQTHGCREKFTQIELDLKPFDKIDMTLVVPEAIRRFSEENRRSICHYVIKDNKVRLCAPQGEVCDTKNLNDGAQFQQVHARAAFIPLTNDPTMYTSKNVSAPTQVVDSLPEKENLFQISLTEQLDLVNSFAHLTCQKRTGSLDTSKIQTKKLSLDTQEPPPHFTH